MLKEAYMIGHIFGMFDPSEELLVVANSSQLTLNASVMASVEPVIARGR